VEIIAAADADLLDYLLVEVVQQLLPSFFAPVVNFRFEVFLKLIELERNLFRRAALLIDRDDALLEVHAGLNGPEHFVARAENSVKQAELFVEELIDPHVGSVAPVKKVDDHNVELLAVPVASADALLDALRIPRKVVVDHQIAELQVDPLGGR